MVLKPNNQLMADLDMDAGQNTADIHAPAKKPPSPASESERERARAEDSFLSLLKRNRRNFHNGGPPGISQTSAPLVRLSRSSCASSRLSRVLIATLLGDHFPTTIPNSAVKIGYMLSLWDRASIGQAHTMDTYGAFA
jgi:hypothetical protein